jgi:hypothetical protein
MRINLTASQIEQLRPYFDRVKAAAVMGSPGMLVGQIGFSSESGYGISVGFLDHEKAKLITEAAREDIPGRERLKASRNKPNAQGKSEQP